MLQIIFGAFGWIIREERVADAEFRNEFEKRVGGGEQRAAVVDSAIEVESDVADGLEAASDFKCHFNGVELSKKGADWRIVSEEGRNPSLGWEFLGKAGQKGALLGGFIVFCGCFVDLPIDREPPGK